MKQKPNDEPRIVKRGGVVSAPCLRIEGPVVQRWLPVLEMQSHWLLRQAETTYLDLTGVTEVDLGGAALLRSLASSYSVRILGCPPSLANELVDESARVSVRRGGMS